jgi:cupin 2 domain-containing protein
MGEVQRGRLDEPATAPASGERVVSILEVDGMVIEQILSGRLDAPAAFVQDHGEWVVVLDGGAILDLDGERIELVGGDWVYIAPDAPHRVVRTEPGTNWLAVHLPGSAPD